MNFKPELTIDVGDGGIIRAYRPVVEEVVKQKEVAKEVLEMDPLRRDTIRAFEDLLRQDAIKENRFVLEVLGQHLYKSIFPDCIHDALELALKTVPKGERLRLQLTFTGDSIHLISLPWEFLYSPVREIFLATDTNLVLSRFRPLEGRETLNAGERPLRVLVMISRPKDENDIIAKDVVEAIKIWGEPEVANQPARIVVKVVEQPSLESLETYLTAFNPHVFHFIGHGTFDEEKQKGFLALVDPETGKAQACEDKVLIDSFKGTDVFPRLVFLHMCEGGVTKGDITTVQAFSGFAPKLIQARIPSVVAMQYPIKNSDARAFCLAFYAKLAEGETVDAAVQEGRRSIDKLRQSRVFGTPVLYMHSTDGIILPPKVSSPGSMPTDQATDEKKTDEAKQPPVTPPPISDETPPTSVKVVDELLVVGEQAMQENVREILHMQIRKQLMDVRDELKNKSANDMGMNLFKRWKEEPDETIKAVWQAMINALL